MNKNKLDPDFKREVDTTQREAWYILKKSFGIIIIIAIVIFALSYGFRFVGKQADNRIFKQTTAYNEGMLDDLAKYRKDVLTAKDDVEKNAIAELVTQRFANYDQSKIENDDLRYFLKDCLDGKYTITN